MAPEWILWVNFRSVFAISCRCLCDLCVVCQFSCAVPAEFHDFIQTVFSDSFCCCVKNQFSRRHFQSNRSISPELLKLLFAFRLIFYLFDYRRNGTNIRWFAIWITPLRNHSGCALAASNDCWIVYNIILRFFPQRLGKVSFEYVCWQFSFNLIPFTFTFAFCISQSTHNWTSEVSGIFKGPDLVEWLMNQCVPSHLDGVAFRPASNVLSSSKNRISAGLLCMPLARIKVSNWKLLFCIIIVWFLWLGFFPRFPRQNEYSNENKRHNSRIHYYWSESSSGAVVCNKIFDCILFVISFGAYENPAPKYSIIRRTVFAFQTALIVFHSETMRRKRQSANVIKWKRQTNIEMIRIHWIHV